MAIAVGSSVWVRSERWVVVGCNRFETCTVVSLEGRGVENAGRQCRLIEPFDRLRQVNPDRLHRRKRDSVLRSALTAAVRERPASGLWTAADARITLLPYQLEPALAVLDGATRILLADEVGLGKTIQAGLILSELRARGLVDRALILAPAGLRQLWASELHDRFGMRAEVLDLAAVAQRTATMPAETNPWALTGITITSLDFAKRTEVLAAIEEAPFDLLIADEAHHLTPDSDRGTAVARLAARIPWVVLVSATPHSGDEDAFNYLTRIGALNDRLAIFQRSRQAVGIAGSRRTHLLAIRTSAAEAEMLRATERYARAIWQARGAVDRGVRLVATTLARRAASSTTAFLRTLTRRLALMSGQVDPSPRQPRLPWDDLDDGDDDDPEWLGCIGLEDGLAELRQLEALIALAQVATLRASKPHRLVRLLESVNEPVVIFTEYRDTLEALQQVLEPAWPLAVIHGGLAPAIRQHAVERFTRGDARVLIATDTAGEGLNLHYRCRVVINVELPWNPRRLEQRVGRVDRIGQSKCVHAFHLIHRDTIEERVLARLEHRRLNAARGLLNATGWVSEEEIAHTALGERSMPERAAPTIRGSRVARATAERSRAEEERRLRAAPGRVVVAADTSWSLPRRRSARTSRVILAHLVHHLDPDLRVMAERCVPIAVDLAIAPGNREQWRSIIEALAADARVRAACINAAEEDAPRVSAAIRPLALALASRIKCIRSHLGRTPTPLRQVSLFDRRSEAEAVIRQRARARVDAHLALRARLVPGNTHVSIRLIAAWPTARASLESGR
jgi:superfamily II DNA or RNA helicase